MNPLQKKQALSEGWISTLINTVLFILKYWAGILTGSIAIIADAWHTLSDTLTSVILIVGVKISSKPPDRKHPFGHGRAELISSVIIGVLLAVVAFNFLRESISRLQNHESPEFQLLAVIVIAVSVVLKESLAQYAFWVFRKTGFASVKADGWHHRSDSIASLFILIGLYVGKYIWWIDGAMGILVSILILYATYEIMRSAINPLIGEEADEKTIEKINELAKINFPFNVNLHHIHIHKYGEHVEMTCHIKLSPELTVVQAHQIASRLETVYLESLGMVTTIHVEPVSIKK